MEKKMLSQEEKAYRYEILETGIQNRLADIQKDLAFDLRCSVSTLPLEELEPVIENEIKYLADELFAGQPESFYLIDYIIAEQTGIAPYPHNPYQPQTRH